MVTRNSLPSFLPHTTVPSVYILLAAGTSIHRISLEDPEDYNDVTIVDGLSRVLVVDYLLTSSNDGLMFFGDINLDNIYSANLNGTGTNDIYW